MKKKDLPKVYLIDDDPVFRSLVSHLLPQHKLIVEAFEEPAKFLERIRQAKPDLCMVDLNLGARFAGLEILELIKKESGALPPTIMVSGTKDRGAVQQSLERGAKDYLVKPLERTVLFRKLSKFIPGFGATSPGVRGTPVATELQTELGLDCTMAGLDELGLVILSKHLMLTGTKVRVSGELLTSITQQEGALELHVLSSGYEEATATYRHYLEFDPQDQKLRASARKWIEAKTQKP